MSEDKPKAGPHLVRFRPRSSSPDPRALYRQLRQERADASEAVEPILEATPRDQWPRLAEQPELLTCGALERIGKLFADAFGKDPLHALTLAELGVALAEAVSPDAYPAIILSQCLAHAWKDLGRAYRVLDRNQESIDALRRAETFLQDNGALTHDLAIVRFNLGVTLQEVGRYDEALQLLNESQAVFRNHGDTRLLVFCGIAEGILFQRLRRFREARETFLLLLASTRDIEPESLAALYQAIGFCSIELNDLTAAEANLDEALKLNRQFGRPVEILKIELGRGRLLVRRGESMLAIHHLRPVRRRFLSHSMPEEAGLCGLEIVDALLCLSRFGEAETLAKTLVSEFTVAHLNRRAITALGYLTEAIESRKASSKLVADIREYIVSLRTEPERDFTYLTAS